MLITPETTAGLYRVPVVVAYPQELWACIRLYEDGTTDSFFLIERSGTNTAFAGDLQEAIRQFNLGHKSA